MAPIEVIPEMTLVFVRLGKACTMQVRSTLEAGGMYVLTAKFNDLSEDLETLISILRAQAA